MIQLQVLIVAFGRKGIESVASLPHPQMEGVEYIVSWQYGDDAPDVPEALLARPDFRVMPTPTRGVALNRNLTLAAASAPIVLESDDDVSYTPAQLRRVIDAFSQRPDVDFISFMYESDLNPREYPDHEFDLRDAPKGYFIGGIEMAFRPEPFKNWGSGSIPSSASAPNSPPRRRTSSSSTCSAPESARGSCLRPSPAMNRTPRACGPTAPRNSSASREP